MKSVCKSKNKYSSFQFPSLLAEPKKAPVFTPALKPLSGKQFSFNFDKDNAESPMVKKPGAPGPKLSKLS